MDNLTKYLKICIFTIKYQDDHIMEDDTEDANVTHERTHAQEQGHTHKPKDTKYIQNFCRENSREWLLR